MSSIEPTGLQQSLVVRRQHLSVVEQRAGRRRRRGMSLTASAVVFRLPAREQRARIARRAGARCASRAWTTRTNIAPSPTAVAHRLVVPRPQGRRRGRPRSRRAPRARSRGAVASAERRDCAGVPREWFTRTTTVELERLYAAGAIDPVAVCGGRCASAWTRGSPSSNATSQAADNTFTLTIDAPPTRCTRSASARSAWAVSPALRHPLRVERCAGGVGSSLQAIVRQCRSVRGAGGRAS